MPGGAHGLLWRAWLATGRFLFGDAARPAEVVRVIRFIEKDSAEAREFAQAIFTALLKDRQS